MPQKVKQYIDENNFSKVYVIGGNKVIFDSVKDSINNSERIAGNDRFRTNIEIAKYFANVIDYGRVYIAIGKGRIGNEFADALSASALAAQTNSFVFLTEKDVIRDITLKHLEENMLSSTITIAIGGKNAISEEVLNKATLKFSDIKENKTISSSDVNIRISGDNVSLVDTMANKNLFVDANKVLLKNVVVKGILYVNPGKDGETTLDGVKANRIVILSGGQNSIYFKNVEADRLEVKSNEKVRVVSLGNTSIKQTAVDSSVKLEVQEGSFGAVNVKSKEVELKGLFDRPVVLMSSTKIVADEAQKLNLNIKTDEKVEIKGNIDEIIIDSKGEVKLSGNIKNIYVNEESKLDLESAKVESIKTDKKVEVNVDKNSKINKTEGQGKVDLKGEGVNNSSNDNNTTGGSSGGNTGGSSGGSTGQTYQLIATKQTEKLTVVVSKKGNNYKIKVISPQKQIVTMRIEDSKGNIQYIDQIDDLEGSREIETSLDEGNYTLYIRGTLTEIIIINF
ncbi:cell wall-binding repeat-containing protein [Caloramator sp. mosi_1]|uniref:cell wall-binding repeat-containing protein n=1 Tax=Caloramator sp. mosi_1 TaxID=3023090 RepID=UPI002362BA0C|nr:cell wall-binding repeat-containing protein [Caloramator sp. mosi_1]WDC84968.1 cell wall-binding repeat-containing protein [Caloramator sp. mosi_1]